MDTTMPGLVRRSHANPLLRALTSYLARKPPIPRLGEAAHARISGPACALAGSRRCEGCTQGHVKSRVLWRLVEAASFRVVVC